MNSSHSTPTTFASPVTGTPEVLWPAQALLGEGLCWSPSTRSIWWVDIFGKKLMNLALHSGERREWMFDDMVSAVAERANGRGLIVSMQRGIAFFDPSTARLDMLHAPEPQLPGNRFNDGKCDAQGRYWSGTMDMACTAETGSVYRVTADGSTTHIDCAWAAHFPVVNGPTWSIDGRRIWVNDTARNFMHTGDFDPATGSITNMRVFMRLPKGQGYPDGMTTDAAGRLWVAHWSGACVTCHAPDDGRELARIELPTSNITNVAFGGADMTTLFITSASAELSDEQASAQPLKGSLFMVKTDAVGIPAHRFAG
ncbi:SMP-30/gluconolactonase/LRE family protein [Piscinibacter terrae]|uniref:SMP-30/gluconolactonase/LRE family protein n=1 Tax=Piscinibacter terrae TaxID=2496871 RepID=A0A3N7HT81_9BURK|nr:SMP-30/gluconolactonase/LRE family protein [Albitalea terrae]RQP25517.1 SMP-30/gluconolactonase/LRE family protein [Albitalea terrae]